MTRLLYRLLLALVLLFGLQAAQSHALAHFGQDLACAQGAAKGPCHHQPTARCLAFHAMDSAPPGLAPALVLRQAAPPAPASVDLPLPSSTRIVFDSRAPPALS